MNLHEMRSAVSEARATLEAADETANELAKLLIGRLRKVHGGWHGSPLRMLKKELQQFNAATGRWKDEA